MTSATTELSVVVPAYNEELRLRPSLDAVRRYLADGPWESWEIVVVDDGSGDRTRAIAEEAAAADARIQVVAYDRNRGKGYALRQGVAHTRGRLVLVTDADLATPVDELEHLEKELGEDCAAAVGSRARPGSTIETHQSRLRELLGRGGNFLIRAVAVPGIRDTQCGFKLFDGAHARAAFAAARTDGWAIDVEVLRYLRGRGLGIAEVPVRWAHQEGSKVRPLDYPRVLGELVVMKARATPPLRLAVLGFFLLASFLLHQGRWPDPSSRYLPDSLQDQNQWEWFFAVTADNVLHLRNPLFTDLQGFPDGVNLMANTVMLGLSVPLAPVTAAFGAALSLALVMTFGLAATGLAWYWLIRKWLGTGRVAAVVGGLLAAFAPPMVSHANAHPNFVVLFMIPLIVDRALRLCVPGARVVRDGVVLGLFAAYQIFLGEEPLLLAVIGMLLFAVAYAVLRRDVARAAWRPLGKGLAIGAGVALPIVAYPLYWQFFGPQSYHSVLHGEGAGNSPLALLSFAERSLAGSREAAEPLALNITEQNAFYGWPLVTLAVAITLGLWHRAAVRALAFTALAAAFLSLGPEFRIPFTEVVLPGPWRPLAHAPLFESVIESRVAMVCAPALGMLVALAVDRLAVARPSRRALGPVSPIFAGPRLPQPSAGRCPQARSPSLRPGGPPLAARPNHPSTSGTRAIRAHAESTLPQALGSSPSLRPGGAPRAGGTPMTPRPDPQRSGRRALGLAAVAAALVPIVPMPLTTVERVAVPPFITDGTWRRYVDTARGETLVPVPLPDPGNAEGLHWQTAAGLGFKLPGGYFNGPWGEERIGIYGAAPRHTANLLRDVRYSGRAPRLGEAWRRQAAQDLAYWNAGALVLAPQPGAAALRATVRQLLGKDGELVDGVWVWDLDGQNAENPAVRG
ncbi:glycosyltransferase [Streptomyces sp. B-S-A12]|uniref:dolichyl-phosphate beta-glucosyltransferase n=1 Tax=Streptomyces luteolus TaxID=3043615 RepID=A0ABT6SYB6_9ACTN|nr:glycosyltransferase [Streptomyces sp. B-S-A12]MDI3420365.1 glycosyltransferase [Streptomyces sp. B-S-A12]